MSGPVILTEVMQAEIAELRTALALAERDAVKLTKPLSGQQYYDLGQKHYVSSMHMEDIHKDLIAAMKGTT